MKTSAVTALLCAFLAIAQPVPAAPPAARPDYPPTARTEVVERHFGIDVADPYHWLEQDVRADPAVRAWADAQDKFARQYLESLPGRALLRTRMRALSAHGRFTLPKKAGRRYFYGHNSGLQNQTPLYVREGLKGHQRLLIDPASLSADGSRALAEWLPSTDGRLLLYAVQDAGSDWRTLHVVDVQSGAVLGDRIEWVKFTQLAWDARGSGFFYSRFDAPALDDGPLSATRGQKLYYHRLGTAQTQDLLIHATPNHPTLSHTGQVTADGRWLVISSYVGTDPRREIRVAPLNGGKIRPRRLMSGMQDDWRLIGSQGDLLYFLTSRNAPHMQVVALDASRPGARPRTIVAERDTMLAGGSLVGDRLILAYQDDGRTVAELVGLDGRKIGDVPLPGVGAAAGFVGRAGDPETFFSFSGFTMPAAVYRFDTATATIAPFALPDLPFDPDDYLIEETRYLSKDGTAIPLTIIRKKALAQKQQAAPTILYGYGGFNIALTPGYAATRMAWVEQGGVYAIAHLRGGGEYGRAWHEAGRRANKQNVFDDFIAAAEYLKAAGYTRTDGLAIEGRSNGGLLVGAVVNQRPDLFGAALPAVGVMDMLRFDRFTAGRYWIDDYGSPARKADFLRLRRYSPYHNIRPGRAYPAILATTGDNDDRVVPAHSFKYVAALQAADIGPRPHLLRIDRRAGHGSGKPIDQLIDEYADSYAFAAYFTGLQLPRTEKGDDKDAPSRP